MPARKYPNRCVDCGRPHDTIAEALACDHRMRRHPYATRGCPLYYLPLSYAAGHQEPNPGTREGGV